jgi:3-oxoacyl-[acyl-carrier-protein] synthase I
VKGCVKPLAIDSIGMLTPLAADAGGSVGCIYTNARRFDELGLSFTGAKVPIPGDLIGLDRLVRLGGYALFEAIYEELAAEKIGLVVCAPSEVEEPAMAGQSAVLLERLAAESELSFAPRASRVFASGRSAIFEALPFARAALLQPDLAAVCILGVDSLVTKPRLKQFLEQGGTPGAGGRVPGEAAAAVVLTLTTDPQALALLRSFGTASEPSMGQQDSPNMGKGLIVAIDQAVTHAQLTQPVFSGLVHDTAGSAGEAEELAWAKTGRAFALSSDMQCLFPHVSTGDAGAAMGVLSLATLAFLIDKVAWPTAGLCCVSSDFQRGAAILTPSSHG